MNVKKTKKFEENRPENYHVRDNHVLRNPRLLRIDLRTTCRWAYSPQTRRNLPEEGRTRGLPSGSLIVVCPPEA